MGIEVEIQVGGKLSGLPTVRFHREGKHKYWLFSNMTEIIRQAAHEHEHRLKGILA